MNKKIGISIAGMVLGFILVWLEIFVGSPGRGMVFNLGILFLLAGGLSLTWMIYSQTREREKKKLKDLLKEEKE